MAEFKTRGEQLLRRTLMATREHGTPHYVPGQLKAGVTDPKVLSDQYGIDDDGGLAGEVTYVDTMGHAVLVLCVKEPGEDWLPILTGRAGHYTFSGWKSVGEGEGMLNLALSEKMLAALKAAEEALGGRRN